MTKKKQLEEETKCMRLACNSLSVNVNMFSANGYRLSKLGKIIDYYPKSQKCFWHFQKEWGHVENLNNFLQFEFK